MRSNGLRVLMLSHMYPSPVNPTAGIFVHEQVRALRSLGHDVRVVSPKGWAPPLMDRWRAGDRGAYLFRPPRRRRTP